MLLQIKHIVMVTALLLGSVSMSSGASLTITSAGPGTYVVQGESLDGVAGIDLTIGYDASSLSSPTVSWGTLVSGAMSIANTNVPGSIKIAIIRTEPFSGSGPVATLIFSSQAGSGGIKSVAAKLIDSKGGVLPVLAGIAPGTSGTSEVASSGLISNAGIPFSQAVTPSVASSAGSPAASASTSHVTAGLGTVSMPGDSQAKNEVRTPEPKQAQPLETPETAESKAVDAPAPSVEKVAEIPEPAEVKETVYVSILERFRGFQGEKSPENLSDLFSKPISAFIRQEPGIVISDGKATVMVYVDITTIKGAAANFALSGARLVSLKKGDDTGTWVLEALPQANSVKATVTVVNSSTVIEYPLTIVPPVAAVSAKQSDFAAFLKDSGAKTPKHDLNGDGRHDYVDDYIYAGHYLNNPGVTAHQKK